MGFSAVPEEGYLPQDLLRTRKELTEMGAPKYEPPPSRPHPPARGAEGYRWYGYYRPARRVRRGNCLRASLPERRGRPARREQDGEPRKGMATSDGAAPRLRPGREQNHARSVQGSSGTARRRIAATITSSPTGSY